MSDNKSIHWADITADRIIAQRGQKDCYTLASGITPSGVVHFGNFREVITVDFVAKALRDKGKDVRFIFSWDNYDTFRKVPKNIPNKEELQKFLYMPIVDVPDPRKKASSYAAYNQDIFEDQLTKMQIDLSPIYQANHYRNGTYKEQIKIALDNASLIREILNKHRTSKLEDNWLPISTYCKNCNTDHKIRDLVYKKEEASISYNCHNCNTSGVENLNTTSRVKLGWRIDWPMRWAYERVDFEPGGKDHSSEGGSFSTSKEIVKVFNYTPPIYLQYDFISFKGKGGKMSSSEGNLVTVDDALEIYSPQIIRFLFASYKSNVDFSIGFDLDVIKVYEDFDRAERVVYGLEEVSDKKKNYLERIYQLSLKKDMPDKIPFRTSFRHLTNILQINANDIQKTMEFYKENIKTNLDRDEFLQRAQCAINWLGKYAPDEFTFKLNSSPPEDLKPSNAQKEFLKQLLLLLNNNWQQIKSDKDLHQKIFQLIKDLNLEPKEVFTLMYKLFINKQKGPRLAGFILIIGKDKTCNLISKLI